MVYLIHFILIDIWARNGVLHIFWGGIDRTHFQKTTNIEVLKKLIRSLHTVPSILTDCASPLLRALQDLCIDHFGHSPSWGVDVGAAGWVCP